MATKEQMAAIQTLAKKLGDYRSVFESQWSDIIKYLAPSYASASPSGEPGTQGAPDFKAIFDTTAIYASNVLADGLQGYAFGRSMSWFRLRFEHKELMDIDQNKEWLQEVERHIYEQMDKSNFYDEARAFLRCGADFGTALMTMDEDKSRAIPTFHALHPGTYVIEEDRHGEVTVMVRTFWLTYSEAADLFGADALPDQMDDGKDDPTAAYEFNHYVAKDNRIKVDVPGTDPWISIYWATIDKDAPVKEERFENKPFFAWRWAKNPCSSPWGVDNPGMVELPNIKLLQSLKQDQIRLSQMQARPPIKRTEGLRVNFTPSGFTDITPGADFAPVQLVGNLQWTEGQIALYRQQIDASYHKDFFLSLMSNLDRIKTATEVNALMDEKSAIMSSFFSRLCHEFIEAILEAIYDLEHKSARLPAPPISIPNKEFRIDFVSPLAMLQKRAHGYNTTKQFVSELFAIAEINPEVIDRIDIDGFVEVASESYDVDQRIIRSDGEVEAIRKARAQMQAQQLQFQNQIEAAKAGAQVYGAASKAPERGSPAQSQADQQGGRK